MPRFYLYEGKVVTIVWSDGHECAVEDDKGYVHETKVDNLELTDYYRMLASRRYKVPYEQVTDDQRYQAKALAFKETYSLVKGGDAGV